MKTPNKSNGCGDSAAQHTPGPWAVMPCPDNAGLHPYHDSRWIATAGAEVERGHDKRDWFLSKGSLICQMRDGDTTTNARLIAAAPDLLESLKGLAVWRYNEPCFCDAVNYQFGPDMHRHSIECKKAREAITKAEGRAE